MSEKRLFTSESVTEGHPDKIADQISDSVLDAILSQDPNAKVACETLVTTGLAFIAGEITTNAYVDIPTLARKVIGEIGYTDAAFGFDCNTCSVLTSIDEQSPDIAMGVVGKEGAGDQGMMFGYACRETDTMMPAPIFLAHRMSERLAWVRRNEKGCDYLRPDGKTQVTVEYIDGKPHRIDTVVVSTQHSPDVKDATIRKDVDEKVVRPMLTKYGFAGDGYRLLVNPTGRFVEGGPKADCGLTGRKIIVDTYGGMGSHGGGAFSGKDPSKVDRSASYAARHIAKNIVAAELADECEIQIAYAIGEKEPVSVMVDAFGTGKVSNEKLTAIVREVFDLTPKGIIDRLKLRRGIYRKTAAYGHFGREDQDFTWEHADHVDELRKRV
ncbi:MAG TPA: methionine adenosyltransferase [Candidatus Krumholzibacteria bacterium]|nr:methionine adenosyltransferase [Candidatus Krumholzibacteria bacterium]